MRDSAKFWDLEHNAPKDLIKYRKWLKRINTTKRPCDWCGEELGIKGVTIHKDCVEKERDFWLDLLY